MHRVTQETVLRNHFLASPMFTPKTPQHFSEQYHSFHIGFGESSTFFLRPAAAAPRPEELPAPTSKHAARVLHVESALGVLLRDSAADNTAQANHGPLVAP